MVVSWVPVALLAVVASANGVILFEGLIALHQQKNLLVLLFDVIPQSIDFYFQLLEGWLSLTPVCYSVPIVLLTRLSLLSR